MHKDNDNDKKEVFDYPKIKNNSPYKGRNLEYSSPHRGKYKLVLYEQKKAVNEIIHGFLIL